MNTLIGAKIPLYGALIALLLSFSGAGLAQDEAVRDYNRYLGNQTAQLTETTEQNQDQRTVIQGLERRINCLELTKMPCEQKAIVREANPLN